jgi:hypothetical protein
MTKEEGSPNNQMTMPMAVIPSEGDNGAAREAATWTGGPEAERMGSERIKFREETEEQFRGILRLRGAYPERAKRVEWAPLRMAIRHSDFVIISSFGFRHSSFL